MTGVRALLDKAMAEALILVRYPEDIARQMMSGRIVDGCRDAADRLDVELAQLRMRKANDVAVQADAADYHRLSMTVSNLFNPNPTTHWKVNPEGTEVGVLTTVLEQVVSRLEACPCYCRPATEADAGSKRVVTHWIWDEDGEDVFVCTRCAALGRVMDVRVGGLD